MVVFHSKTQVKPKFLVLSASELLLGSYHAFFNVTAKRLSFITSAFLYFVTMQSALLFFLQCSAERLSIYHLFLRNFHSCALQVYQYEI